MIRVNRWTFGSGQFLHCARYANSSMGRPNSLERKVLMDCIAPASFTHPPLGLSSLSCPKIAFLYLTISFRLLRGWALTTLRAGWALKVVGSLVKGLIPSRAGLAGR